MNGIVAEQGGWCSRDGHFCAEAKYLNHGANLDTQKTLANRNAALTNCAFGKPKIAGWYKSIHPGLIAPTHPPAAPTQ